MSNKLRITGLATGLDVDTMVKTMMKADSRKIDSLKQQRQLLVWKQEIYRSYLTDMTSFKNNYFNVLKSDSNMLSSNNYSGFDVTNAVSSTSSTVTATASAGAMSGTYNVKDITTALKASYSSTVKTNIREAENPVQFKVSAEDITTANYDNITIRLNDTDYKISLSGEHANLSSLVNTINTKLQSADNNGTATDISKKVVATLSEDGTSVKFAATSENTLNSVSDTNNTVLAGNSMNFNIKIEAGVNDRLLFNINGTTTSITLDPGSYTGLSNLTTKINEKLQASGINTSVEASMSLDGNRIKFVNKNTDNQVSVQGTASNTLGFPALGFDIMPNTSVRMSSLFSDNASAKVKFTINNKEFNYDFSSTGADKDKTMYNVMNEISSAAGVKMSYSELGRKFTIESLTTGQTQSVTASEALDGSEGNFLQSIFGTRTISATGRDSSVTVTNPKGDSLTLTKSNNTINIDGITVNLLKDDLTAEGINLNVTSNTQKTFDKIVSFVDKYNELVGKIQTSITEKRQYNYLPLTDEQRESMNETDIKNWEEKTKEGLVRNDSSLQNMVYKLRRAFFDEVEGAGIKLSDIGLSTSSNFREGGKIVIDEAKLKNAIQNNGTQVSNIFSKTSSIDYDASHKTDTGRYEEIGIFQRINDIFKDYSRTTRDNNGQKGILVEKAGVKGDISEYQSIISKQITDNYDDKIKELTKKLAAKENKYYLQFAELEVAMQKMNDQSSWLSSQLGSLG